MKLEWSDISSAPRDGRTIWARRVHKYQVVWVGAAAWRTFTSPSFINGTHGVEPEHTFTGWMYPDRDKRVPEPTHWKPGRRVSAPEDLRALRESGG